MSFPRIRITDAGKVLVATALSGNGSGIRFTRFMVGSGEAPEDETAWDSYSSLIMPMLSVNIVEYERDDDVINLYGEFSNASTSFEFFWKELGIYGVLTDGSSDIGYETLMFYGNAGELAEYVPGPDAEVSVRHRWRTQLVISSAADVSAVVKSITYAMASDLNDHVQNQQNPHGVTKAQIGLGEVPNVSTNDQKPTYTTASRLERLVSGETMRVLMGKLSRAVLSLIDHISDNANPHNVGYAQVGAPPSNHRASSASYGKGDATYYGHVKLSASVASTSGVDQGIAATPSAVKAAYDAAVAASDLADGALGVAQQRGLPAIYGTYKGNDSVQTGVTLRFSNGLPKLLFIMLQTSSIKTVEQTIGIIIPDANIGFSVYNPSSEGGNYQDLVVTTTGTTVKFTHASSAANGMNLYERIYSYVAIM